MDASENSIPPLRFADKASGLGARSAGTTADKVSPGTAFMGTVTAIKKADGAQTLEVQYSQGKVRFQADGDFQVGERLRLSFSENGSVQVEKGPPAPGSGDQGVGYTLPGNMSTLKDLRDFERKVSQWVASGGRSGTGAASRTGMDAGPAAPEPAALQRLTLPQLLLKAMALPGGKEFLGQALAGAHSGTLSALLEAVEVLPEESPAGSKAALLDMLRSAAGDGNAAGAGKGTRPSDALLAMLGGTTERAEKPGSAGAFLPAESGSGHAPWFGRILERQQADGYLSPSQRLRFGGAEGPPQSGPMYRYMLDMGGGHTLEAFSSEAKPPGSFTDFTLEKQGGRLQAVFMDPAAALPADLKTAMAAASPQMRQGMMLAARYLREFEQEPYFGRLVADFGEVLAQSGRMEANGADGKPAGIPDRKDLDGLLKLFVAFPRDGARPESQAKVWGEAVQDPQAMLRLLKTLKPEGDASLLRSGTALRLAGEAVIPAGVAVRLGAKGIPDMNTTRAEGNPAVTPQNLPPGPAGAAQAGESPEVTAAWLKKLLPEAFRSEDLLNLAKDASLLTPAGKEHDAAKFLLQAVAHAFPREDQIQEGKPAQFYFYQGQEWRNLQVTWERGAEKGRAKAGSKAPLQVRVETQAKHMGTVKVGVSWDPKGARLDFKNQFIDVRDLLSRSLPELERNLALMDFRVTAWTYDLLPDAVPASPDPGWTRPASLSDGANLDLMG
ncbi:MAG: hypothetical protein ABI036_19680 [Fibrobacteria bacterium]